MKQNNIRGEWAGSSHLTEKKEELLKAHQEFLDMLANGYQIVGAKKKSRRSRIHREPTPKRIKVQAGFITIVVEYTDWKAKGSVGKIVEKYY